MKRFFALALFLIPAASQGMVTRQITRLTQLAMLGNTRAFSTQKVPNYMKILRSSGQPIARLESLLGSEVINYSDYKKRCAVIEYLERQSYDSDWWREALNNYLLSDRARAEIATALNEATIGKSDALDLLIAMKQARENEINIRETVIQAKKNCIASRKEALKQLKARKQEEVEALKDIRMLLKRLD